MAVKSKLHTEFTGDSSKFEKAARRTQMAGKKTAEVFKKMNGALAIIGVGAGIAGLKSIIDKMDRIAKVARRMEISAEMVQRLGFAAAQAGTSFESLQAIMTRLERRTGEALLNSTSAAAQAFKELGINLDSISQLNAIDKFMMVSDAFAKSNDHITKTASLMKLLDTEVRELIPLMQGGSKGISEMMGEAKVATNDSVAAAERAAGFFKSSGQTIMAFIGNGIGAVDAAVEDTIKQARKIKKEFDEIFGELPVNLEQTEDQKLRGKARNDLAAEELAGHVAASKKAAADRRAEAELRRPGFMGIKDFGRELKAGLDSEAQEAAKILHEMQMEPVVKGVNKVGEGIEGFFNRLGNGVQATTQKVAELKQKAGEFTEKVREEFPSAQADYPTSANFIGTEDDPFSSGGRAAGGKFGVYSPKALGASSARTGANSPLDKLRTEQDRQAREQRNLTSDLVAETTRLREFFADKLN